MTIILDSKTGRIYSLFWGERDGFENLQREEITMEYAKYLCRVSHDYIEVRSSTPKAKGAGG